MQKLKIRTGHNGFYDQANCNRMALLEEGQQLQMVKELPDNKYICKIVNPSEACRFYGGYNGLEIEAYVQNLEVA